MINGSHEMCSSRTVDTEALAMLPKIDTLFDFQKAAHAGLMGMKSACVQAQSHPPR
jgi:hypothetical protein